MHNSKRAFVVCNQSDYVFVAQSNTNVFDLTNKLHLAMFFESFDEAKEYINKKGSFWSERCYVKEVALLS
jgi:uncharacterized radical SAM superfamily Fe-S cluster-containing enzyme